MPKTVSKTLPFTWKVGGAAANDIEVRPSNMSDVLAAEEEASPMRPNAFNIQMACLQVVRAGTFTGPFAPAHFRQMRSVQFAVIAEAMREADALGED